MINPFETHSLLTFLRRESDGCSLTIDEITHLDDSTYTTLHHSFVHNSSIYLRECSNVCITSKSFNA